MSSARMAPVEASPRWRTLRFAAGFAIGMAVIPAGLVLIVFYAWIQPRPEAPRERSVFVSDGATLSRAGVTSVVWRRENEVLRQTCRDVCDDVEFSHRTARAAQVSGVAADWRPTLKPTKEQIR